MSESNILCVVANVCPNTIIADNVQRCNNYEVEAQSMNTIDLDLRQNSSTSYARSGVSVVTEISEGILRHSQLSASNNHINEPYTEEDGVRDTEAQLYRYDTIHPLLSILCCKFGICLGVSYVIIFITLCVIALTLLLRK